jgi:hypothetical protein
MEMFPLADDFNATSWNDLKPVATNLLERPVEDADDLESPQASNHSTM